MMRHPRPFFAEAVKACRWLGRRGLLLTRFRDQLPASLPRSVRHFDYVPLSQVLPRSAALVSHGGIGTVSQALAAGIPQLVMPLAFDQLDNAARLERLGVAAALLPRSFRGPVVARQMARLLTSPTVARACRVVAARLHKAEWEEATCRAVEELARTSRATPARQQLSHTISRPARRTSQAMASANGEEKRS
jgi:UDP:flavonoid glycosyltransferase YjiC (YdhE family)